MSYKERTVVDTINTWVAKGYTDNFSIKDGKIASAEHTYTVEDVEVDHMERFDGMTNPEDDCVVIALRTHSGAKGTLVVPYGAKTGTPEIIKDL